MAFACTVGVFGSQGGDAIVLAGDFNITTTYQAALVGTDDSIGPVLSGDTQLGASVAPGFSGALPVTSVTDLYYFAPTGRIVIEPHTANAESVAYAISGPTLVIQAPLVRAHPGGADIRMVVSGLDGVPPFSAPMASGVGGSPSVVAALSATSMTVFAPPLPASDAIAYNFLRAVSFGPNEQIIPGPATSTQTVRTFRVQLTDLQSGAVVQSDNTLVLAASFLCSSVYDMRRYLSNYNVGSRSADQEGGLWGQ